MTIYKYRLQPYTTIASRKKCPNCGHPREFSLYVDENGNPLDESCGRCNREKCGYHYPPKEYFKDNPDKVERGMDSNNPIRQSKGVAKCDIQPPKAVDYLPSSLIVKNDTYRPKNNLFRFMAQEFGEVEANRVFDLYHVGTSKHWKNHDGLSTTFLQVDEQGRVRQCKVMAYNPTNGKRIKKTDDCMMWNNRQQNYVPDYRGQDKIWFAGKTILNNQEANLQQTFFGCHLIRDASIICIVESEKTALICSILKTDVTWIATGGCNGCRWTDATNISLFKGKRVILCPDSGMYSKWREKAEAFKDAGIDIAVSAECCNQPDNTDIADLVMTERMLSKQKPTTMYDVMQWAKELGIEKGRITYNI